MSCKLGVLMIRKNYFVPLGLDARKPVFGCCEQLRRRPACAFAQTDERLCFYWKVSYNQNFNFLASLYNIGTGFSIALSELPKTGLAEAPI